jgi:hypothetical protein
LASTVAGELKVSPVTMFLPESVCLPKLRKKSSWSWHMSSSSTLLATRSVLCNDQYCSRYIVGTRGKGEVNTGTNHLGFRCVKSPGTKEKRTLQTD